MATSTNAPPHSGYEKTDASPRGLVRFALIMAVILAATSLSLIFLFKHFERADSPGSFVSAPFAGAQPLPPPPRIQPQPGVDIQNYDQSQQNLLNTYGWVDKQNGVVRLPIDRAMQLLLERGLPLRSATQPQTQAGAKTRTRQFAAADELAPKRNRSAGSAGLEGSAP